MSLRESLELSLASPDRARSLFTVRAAISSAVSSLRPRSRSPSLMCSYCRSRLELHAFCGIVPSLLVETSFFLVVPPRDLDKRLGAGHRTRILPVQLPTRQLGSSDL